MTKQMKDLKKEFDEAYMDNDYKSLWTYIQKNYVPKDKVRGYKIINIKPETANQTISVEQFNNLIDKILK